MRHFSAFVLVVVVIDQTLPLNPQPNVFAYLLVKCFS